ncbi:potassium-transporting ATPase subunit C [Aliihoeflea sp. PC F10.4]
MLNALLASLRITVATMGICVVGYATVVWAFAQAVTPDTAEGSLIVAEAGTVVGSRQIAQAFTQPGYFWPRPSAVDYDGAGAGGSNWSPTSPDVAARGEDVVATYGATADNPLPADLAAASGAGLDPHISEAGALYQVPRIAEARGFKIGAVEDLVRREASAPGGFLGPDRIVNVLELNLALDAL